MSRPRPRTLRYLAGVVLVCSLVAGGCASLRLGTYPRDFVYLTEGELSGAMHELAAHMGALSNLLDDLAAGADAESVADVMVTEVDSMRKVTDRLGVGSPGTNHLLLDAHLSEFVDDLEDARRTLNATPPRFYQAGRLVGSCSACHRFR